MVLDRWLLAVVERASHAIQRATGWSLSWQRCQVTCAWGLLDVLDDRLADRPAILAVVTLLLVTSIAFDPYMRESTVVDRALHGVANWRKVYWASVFVRLSWAGVIGWSLFVLALAWSWTAVFRLVPCGVFWVVLYLDACDGLPPCAGRIREWWGAPLKAQEEAA